MKSIPAWQLVAIVAISCLSVAPGLAAVGHPCNDRTVAVNVYNRAGLQVLGLQAANFRAELRGKPVTIASAVFDTGPRRVLIVLDASESMEKKWKLELRVADRLLASAPPQVTFGLLTFSTHIQDRIGLTPDRSAIRYELSKLLGRNWQVKGRRSADTALYDALEAALAMLRPARTGDTIYFISDGFDNASHVRVSQTKKLVLQSQVRLFALITENLNVLRRNPETNISLNALLKLVDDSGGYSLFFPFFDTPVFEYAGEREKYTRVDRDIFTKATLGFLDEITRFYRLELQLPVPLRKDRGWKLKVVEPTARHHPHFELVYPQKLAPCR